MNQRKIHIGRPLATFGKVRSQKSERKPILQIRKRLQVSSLATGLENQICFSSEWWNRIILTFQNFLFFPQTNFQIQFGNAGFSSNTYVHICCLNKSLFLVWCVHYFFPGEGLDFWLFLLSSVSNQNQFIFSSVGYIYIYFFFLLSNGQKWTDNSSYWRTSLACVRWSLRNVNPWFH